MIVSPDARRQIDALRRHYRQKNRPEAARALAAALRSAAGLMAAGAGLAAPRPYPDLARPGERWLKSGRYWFAYTVTSPPIILAVFYDAADIPSRR